MPIRGPDEPIHSYLLGEMPEEERAVFEQRIFADDELFASVLAAENNLIDALVRGELAPAEAERLRGMLYGSGQQERIRVAAALAARGRRARRPHVPWQWFAVAACLLLALVSASLLWTNQRLRNELARGRPPSTGAAIFSVSLFPGLARGRQTEGTIQLPARAGIIELRLALRPSQGYERYRLDLAPEAGRPFLSQLLPPANSEARIALPRQLLPPGAYEIVLSGLRGRTSEALDSYHFAIR